MASRLPVRDASTPDRRVTTRASLEQAAERAPFIAGRSAARRAALTLLCTVAAAVICYVISGLVHGETAWARPQDAGATAGLIGLAVLGYVGWASRWNIPAHLMLGFALTAYFIPTCVGTIYSRFPDQLLDRYDTLVIVGFLCAVVGAVLGAEIRLPRWADLRMHVDRIPRHTIARRILLVTVVASVLLVASFIVMGFVPAFASDPLNAKFFRGEYAARYAPVAPIYRATTSALILLLPAITMYAVWRRRWYWILLLPTTLVLLVCTLQRGSAVMGVLLFIGIALALLRRRIWVRIFAAGLVLVYGFGSVSYFLLAGLGLGDFAPSQVDTSDVSAVIAAGAPDVSDQVGFLGAWLSDPVYTLGRTIWGGILPNHFAWNPSVWTLSVTNPGGDLNDITSGGLRLPAPLWGYVSFDWTGVVVFSVLTGLVFGLASHSMRRAVETPNRERVVLAFLVYATVIDVLGEFYTLSYMGILQLVVVIAIIFWPRRRRREGGT